MKKISLALLIALLGAGFVTACDDDNDKDKDKNKETESCSIKQCDQPEAIGVVATLNAEKCKCEYSCKSDYDKVDDASIDLGFKCEKKTSCNITQCDQPNAVGVVATLNAEKCKCEYSCKSDYDKVDDTSIDLGFKCEKKSSCNITECDQVDAIGVVATLNAEKCKCEYSCASGYNKIDDTSIDIGLRCEKADDADACKNYPCSINEYGVVGTPKVSASDESGCTCTYTCEAGLEKKDDTTTESGIVCISPDKKCNDNDSCSDDSQCVKGMCRTIDEVVNKTCTDSDYGYCFGDVRVYCLSTEFATMFTKEDCSSNGASCELDDNDGAICVAKVIDPSACTKDNVDAKLYACGGKAGEDVGSFTQLITKTCTNNNGTYEWVETTKDCASYEACWGNHASSGCSTASPLDFDNGRDCYGKDINCKSDYCDPATNKCAEKP